MADTPFTLETANASIDASPSVSIVNDNGSIDSRANVSMVWTRYIGAIGATSRIISRISGAMRSARALFTT